jgi:hypothetical protein
VETELTLPTATPLTVHDAVTEIPLLLNVDENVNGVAVIESV